jgi:hypothetical protein
MPGKDGSMSDSGRPPEPAGDPLDVDAATRGPAPEVPARVDPTTAAPPPGAPGGGDAGPGGTPAGDYTEAGVPTFDHVRDRIEGRYARSLGATELAEDSAPARSLAEQQEERDAAARERLEQIRRSLRGE